jgi:hypothetical protein
MKSLRKFARFSASVGVSLLIVAAILPAAHGVIHGNGHSHGHEQEHQCGACPVGPSVELPGHHHSPHAADECPTCNFFGAALSADGGTVLAEAVEVAPSSRFRQTWRSGNSRQPQARGPPTWLPLPC